MVLTLQHITNVVTEYFKDKPVTKVYLFGSYANGSANEDSDVDLLINLDDKNKMVSFFELLLLNEGITTLLKKKVELVEESMIYERIKNDILSSKKLIYSND